MGVEFDDNKFNRPDFGANKTPKLASFLIAKGLAKDVDAANKLQIIAAIVFFAIAIFLALK